MRKGFTLVELSIVFVIIGLLIGGILAAQSMIETAKVQKILKNLEQYEIAVQNFRGNYKAFPGDSQFFMPPGDASGQYGYGANGATPCALAPNASFSNIEYLQVWAHLSQANMIKGNYIPYSPMSCAGGTHSNDERDPSLAGIVSPYTEVKETGGEQSGKVLIHAYKLNFNFAFFFKLSANQVQPVEAKLGSKDWDNVNPQVGLINNNGGPGHCWDVDQDEGVYCTDSRADGSYMYYFFE